MKKIVLFLERKVTIGGDETIHPINSLAPKILTDEADLDKITPYLDRLKNAIDTDGINNIALTGSYGSGKSTILKTFQYQYSKPNGYEYLNISLASFNQTKNTLEDIELERRLEVSILQQMFYHVEPSKIPDSRFKRIVNVTTKKVYCFSFFLILWTFSIITLFKFSYIEKLNPSSWDYHLSLDKVAFFSSIIFFMGIGLLIKSIYRLLKNSKINKLNIKGELELAESSDNSVFNRYLEEILYFFERTKFNIVIIEDLDRFESTNIFTKLREINILINNSNSIKRAVKFVYAVKDEMFQDKYERVKFFEFIIPVIPFINPTNASDQLTKLINQARLQEILTPDFTSDVLTFIDDIDMRLLINIFHEYQLYKNILSIELNQDNLFAIIVYKNLYANDFGELKNRKGNLYNFFNDKPLYCLDIIKELKEEIERIEEDIELIEAEIDIPVKELRLIYISKIIPKLKNFHSFFIDKEISIDESIEDENFEKIKSSKFIQYTQHVSDFYSALVTSSKPINSDVNFKDVEKDISNKFTYNQREKFLLDKSNTQIHRLKIQKESLNQRINEVESMSIQNLFAIIDNKYLGYFKDNNLMRNLLLNGYINEHYNDYISLFHEVNLTKDDFLFEQKVKSGHILPFDFTLTKIENLIKRIPDHHFRRETILNFQLLSFLLRNEGKYNTKLDNLLRCLRVDNDNSFRFINGFIKSYPDHIGLFIKQICIYKLTLWQFLTEKSGVSEWEIKVLLKHIFNHADINSILNFTSIESLEKYIKCMEDFFSFCLTLNQNNTILEFIKVRVVKIDRLDSPNNSQEKLFKEIYIKNLYELNSENFLVIAEFFKKPLDMKFFEIAQYTTLLKSSLTELLEYIDDNMQEYLQQLILLADSNNQESEETIVSILNREDDVSIDIKTQFIKTQYTVIHSLTAIDDFGIKKILLESNKVAVSWNNVFDYYESTGQEEFDETLNLYLNLEKNYNSLTKDTLSVLSTDEDYIVKISDILVNSESLEISAYTALLNSIPFVNININLDKLSKDKIEVLISKKILKLSIENFAKLKAKNPVLCTALVAKNQAEFIKKIHEFSLDTTDFIYLLTFGSILTESKLSIIKIINEDIIIKSPVIARLVFNVLVNEPSFDLSYDIVNALFKVEDSATRKIRLLNSNSKKYDDTQIQTLLEVLDGDYPKIFMKQHKPVFINDVEHRNLFESLKERGLIIRYKLNNDESGIKVYAKY